MILSGGTTTLGVYDFKAGLDEFGKVDYWVSKVSGYPINQRVMLDDGDIVQNTIEGNTNDPNTDMTGWVNFESDQVQTNKKLENSLVLHSSYFEITGTGDETAKVQALVDYVNSNTWVSKVSIDTDITTSELLIFSRSVEIDLNGHTVTSTKDGAKFSAAVLFLGDVDTDTYATLTVDNVPLSNKFTVNDTSMFAVGDYVSATYNRATVAASVYGSEEIVFTAKILKISGNDLYLDHSHGFGIPIVKPWGTESGSTAGTQLDICKSYPILNPKIKNYRFINNTVSTTTRVNAATFYVCIDAVLESVTAFNIGGQVLHNLGSRGTVTKYLSTVDPRSTAGGRGYVVQENGSHDSEHEHLTGVNDRHTHDASTMSSRIKVKNSRGVGSASYSFGCHSSYIHDVEVENCDGSGGFFYGNSSNGNPTDGYFGSATGEIVLKNVSSSGTTAKIFLSPLESVGTNRIINSKIPTTSEAYGVRISANTITDNCDFNTRLRINKHQATNKPTHLNSTTMTVLEGGQTGVVGQPDVIVTGGSITTAQYLNSLQMSDGAKISNNASSNLLSVSSFSIEGGSINLSGATSDLTFNSDATISASTDVVIGRNMRLIGGDINILSKNVDAELTFGATNPTKLTATGAYIRNINMSGGGSNCKLQVSNSEINYMTPLASFDYAIFTSNKVNGGTIPTASARYIVANNLVG